jgi:hypothetical protein
MDMRRFLAFVAKEVEPEPADAQDAWHHIAPITVLPSSYRMFVLLASKADNPKIAQTDSSTTKNGTASEKH